MNTTLWIAAWLLAAVFVIAAIPKLTKAPADLVSAGLDGFTVPQVRGIGAVEVLGVVGLLLPPLVDVAPVLAPVAATGLALVMVAAGVFHARRGELMNVGVNAVLFALAVFVAWGRFGPHSF